LTNQMEEQILAELAAVQRMGGIVDAIKSGALQAEVARQAYRFEQALASGEVPKVGVNCHVADGAAPADPEVELYAFDPAVVGTPENLKREGSFSMPRKDYSDFLRKAFEAARLTDAQREAWQWIVSQPNGPAKVLVISEEWSSDCRRDVPMLARLAAEGGLEM